MHLFHRSNKDNNSMKNGVQLIAVASPQSAITEQFRTIRTNIRFMGVDKEIKTLAFTSGNVSEGKSTVTDNTAVTFAEDGKKVLLIDADLRRPTLHRTFRVSNHVGLTTVLTSDKKEFVVDDVIRPSGIANLSILTAGPKPPNPSELLGSRKMEEFVKLISQY